MLNLDKPGARDPYVERLFEGFAFLMGRLREKLEAKCKKHVELTVRTDASLLGGIRLELPDRQLDGTVQSHLNQIQQLLESSSL